MSRRSKMRKKNKEEEGKRGESRRWKRRGRNVKEEDIWRRKEKVRKGTQ